jgi:hypothetical protein
MKLKYILEMFYVSITIYIKYTQDVDNIYINHKIENVNLLLFNNWNFKTRLLFMFGKFLISSEYLDDVYKYPFFLKGYSRTMSK